MSNFSANFRRYIKRTFSKEELALIERLERQRHRTGRVRAVIDDPSGKFAAVLHAYIAYIQHLDKRDAIVVQCGPGVRPVPRQNFRPSAVLQRSHHITPRNYLRILGPKCIGQILLLDAHAYCPSLPLYRSRLDAILTLALPYACGPNSVLIIHGSSKTQKNTRFRHWLKIAANPESIYYLPPLPQKFVPVRAACGESPRIPAKSTPLRVQIIPNSQFTIPNSKAFAA